MKNRQQVKQQAKWKKGSAKGPGRRCRQQERFQDNSEKLENVQQENWQKASWEEKEAEYTRKYGKTQRIIAKKEEKLGLEKVLEKRRKKVDIRKKQVRNEEDCNEKTK